MEARILLTGGGTGGHIYPLIAVAEAARRTARQNGAEIQFYYLGAPGAFRDVLSGANIKTFSVLGGKLRSYFSFLNFLDVFFTFLSFFQAIFRLFFIMPNAVFSKGGPGSLPVILAARFYRIPVILHESDAVPGRSNLAAARFAARVAISFMGAAKYFKKGINIALTGTPIRELFSNFQLEKTEALKAWGFKENLPVLLFISGSQGAVRMNDFVLNALPELVRRFQIIHQTGFGNYDDVKSQSDVSVKSFTPDEREHYRAVPYFVSDEDFVRAFVAADLVVSRAGGSAIYELAAFGKPAILVPLPESASDHQRINAYEYAKTGAAVVIEQENLLQGIFQSQVEKILGSKEAVIKMSEAARVFAKPEAASAIAAELLKIAFRS